MAVEDVHEEISAIKFENGRETMILGTRQGSVFVLDMSLNQDQDSPPRLTRILNPGSAVHHIRSSQRLLLISFEAKDVLVQTQQKTFKGKKRNWHL